MSESIEYHKFPRGEHCDEEGCRSRQYYIDSGRQFCRRGHIQAQFTQTQQDEDDWNTQGKKTRKRREEKEKVKTLYAGQEARDLFLQCYQLILWKQVHWLVQNQGFPPELEVLVRDLWSFRLRKLVHGEDGDEGDGGKGAYSSTSEDDTGAETDDTVATGTSTGRVNGLEGLKLIDTLGLCYLAMVLLRLPVCVGQLHGWAEREEIVYMRAIRFVPHEMIAKLPASYHKNLDTLSELKRDQLQRSITLLAMLYSIDFGIEFPALNEPLIIFRYIKELGLPLDVYDGVKRLAKLLNIEFKFNPSKSQTIRASTHPEAKIAALIVIATKLSHPFDGIVRIPRDAPSLTMNWSAWKDAMAEKKTDGLKRGQEIHVTDRDVLSMSGDQLDDYLNWYQQMWIDGTEPKMPQKLLDLFPLTESSTSKSKGVEEAIDISERTKRIQSSMIIQNPVSDEDTAQMEGTINRPGSLYTIYRPKDELPDPARAFYKKTAELAAMKLETLVLAAFQLDVKLQVFQHEYKRQEMSARI